MTGLVDAIGQAFGDILGQPVVGAALRFAALYLVILWLASAWWVWRDARSRWRDPIVPYMAAAGMLLVTPLLFPLAAVVYRVLRPSLTTAAAEATELQLAMLEEEAERPACGRCGSLVDEEWVACPRCGSDLAVRCSTCGRPLELDWSICAWCAADIPSAAGGHLAARPPRVALSEPVAISILPGGRPLVPAMAVPEEGEEVAAGGQPAKRRARPRRKDG
jgi:RNA polymerase subunit RPABC4/transcription elongation factor Spt4